MIPLVLGGIALAAVGYGVKEFCESEGCPWDEPITTSEKKDGWNSFKETKKSLHEDLLLGLREVLRKVKGSKHSIDDAFVFTEEKYEQGIVSVHWENVPTRLIQEIEKEAYFRSCSDMLDEAYDIGEFYTKKIENLLEERTDVVSFSKVEKKMLKHAFKFYNVTQALLSKTLVDEEGIVSVATSKAFSLYEEVIEKHKMKVPFFRSGEENYTLFLTALDV